MDGLIRIDPLKPWPADAVMIVAARAGTENRDNMERPVPATCRECGAALMACSFTVQTAWHMPARRGRPVDFFCPECAAEHDTGNVQMHDHSGVTGRLIP